MKKVMVIRIVNLRQAARIISNLDLESMSKHKESSKATYCYLQPIPFDPKLKHFEGREQVNFVIDHRRYSDGKLQTEYVSCTIPETQRIGRLTIEHCSTSEQHKLGV